MSVNELIQKFREAAIAKGDGASVLDAEYHSAMSSAMKELIKRGDRGNISFEKLALDESIYVRLWAASQLLYFGNLGMKQILEEIAKNHEIIGLTAELTLKEFEAGRLQSPL